jgi:hypothetical protein
VGDVDWWGAGVAGGDGYFSVEVEGEIGAGCSSTVVCDVFGRFAVFNIHAQSFPVPPKLSGRL